MYVAYPVVVPAADPAECEGPGFADEEATVGVAAAAKRDERMTCVGACSRLFGNQGHGRSSRRPVNVRIDPISVPLVAD